MTEAAAQQRFREIVIPHLDDAYTLARWMTGDRADAEDVVQEAAIRALSALAATTPLKPRAWWLAVVRNAALTALARRKGARVEDLDAADEIAEPGPDPEAALISRDEGERVREAIARLPPSMRETLILREIEELDYREIALATEVPIGTVMSRLARARTALAKMLGKGP